MAKLPASYANRDAIPEPMREFYHEVDGKWVLSDTPPGFVTQASHDGVNQRLGEFRDNNLQLNEASKAAKIISDALKEKYKDIDPEKVKTDAARLAELEKKGVKDTTGLTDAIAAGVKAAVDPLQTQVTALGTQLTDQKAATVAAELKASTEGKRSTMMAAATSAGVRKSAVADVLNRGLPLFEVLADGSLAGIDSNKQPVYSRENAANRKTVSEWLTELSAGDGQHLFDGSSGGGAEQNQDGSKTPAKIMLNPTEAEVLANVNEIAKGDVRVERK